MLTGNIFKTWINVEKKLFAIIFVRNKGFNREEPAEELRFMRKSV